MIAILKWILGSILLLLALVLGIVAGVAAFLALALLVSDPAVLAVGGVLVCGVVTGSLALLPGRWLVRKHMRRLAVSLSVATALLLTVVGGAFLFRPRGLDQPKPVDRGDVRFESLATGSRLACRVIPARTAARRGGVIFVHGGPGANAVTNDPIVAALSPLADAGFDVCLYDQIGCGLSDRLGNPEGYTAARHVADLETLRRQLGWVDPVLIGESWGAQLIARYAAAYPLGVSAAVLVSPGPLRLADWAHRETGSVRDRITRDQERAFNAVLDARFVTAMLLFRINPQSAFRFLPEAEAEAYGSDILIALAPGAVCNPDVLSKCSQSFLNLWVAQMIRLSLEKEPPDHLDGLSAARFPVLVLRGDCDYAHEGVATEYVDAFPLSKLVTVPDAGHFMLLERPESFLAEVRRFLSQRE